MIHVFGARLVAAANGKPGERRTNETQLAHEEHEFESRAEVTTHDVRFGKTNEAFTVLR